MRLFRPGALPDTVAREAVHGGTAWLHAVDVTDAVRGRKSVLVIVPAYNEASSIRQVIDELRTELPFADVLVVDDGSSDGTASIARARGAHVVSLPFNCGIGTAMQTGYLFAHRYGYDAAVQVDGDGQHDPRQVQKLLAPLLGGQADVVIGSRFLGTAGYKSTAIRRVGIAWLAVLLSGLVRRRITDATSGFRAVNRRVIAFYATDYPTDYPEPEIILPLHRAGFRVVEAPVTMRERRSGKSSITALRSAYYMVKVTLAIAVGFLRAGPNEEGAA